MRVVLAVVVSMLVACGGDDEECGPGDAPADGITVTTSDGAVSYATFTSSPNNDCTPPDGSATSITLDGIQSAPTPTGFAPHIAFCIPRPDEVAVGTALQLGLTDDDDVRLVDVSGDQAGCIYTLDRTNAPTATITLEGYCGDGLNSAGYSFSLAGDVALTRSCPDAETLTATVSGRAAVDAL